MGEKLSLRKQRFMQFSSLEHEGEYYMTPRDFLFSVMFDQMERKLFWGGCLSFFKNSKIKAEKLLYFRIGNSFSSF